MVRARINDVNQQTLFRFWFVGWLASNAPFLKFRWWNQTRRTARSIMPSLPPMMIVFADDLNEHEKKKKKNCLIATSDKQSTDFNFYLQNVTNAKGDASLCTWNQFIVQWIIIELSTNENLKQNEKKKWIICPFETSIYILRFSKLGFYATSSHVLPHRMFYIIFFKFFTTQKGKKNLKNIQEIITNLFRPKLPRESWLLIGIWII